ncbi:ImmA/IrrE family metallo-endopeptidase [Aeromicrobium ginsengisoli]|uniref:ImmA/IrrE family metallo-endopeptidase n=1 Tax=Aeromicrobium ginsengisoli TaxID=363867 RepID=A0A5M4F9N0_9ACTN|nr:ImmA/IrrE family metallo-endopeptidase [Aeromicrobium ginsengisoli]KAA1395116.1 ImmA/IrrE family metallo-endopeptidase [Aeromicrobium ginsengisoli]
MNFTSEGAATVEWLPYKPDVVLPPGDTLLETIEAIGLTQKELATRTGLSAKHINQIVKGDAPLTHETAVLLERVTGIGARFWNALESEFRDSLARSATAEVPSVANEWLKSFPLPHLRALGVINATMREPEALVEQLLEFFGVASIAAWRALWANPEVAYLKSPSLESISGAAAAWLRLGEIEAQRAECEPYDRDRLKAALPALRALTPLPTAIAIPQAVELAAACGVAVVLIPEVPGARASGATRWASPSKAVVQLSDRGKRSDKIWFAFFHELAHVLLHGKRDYFFDEEIGEDSTDAKEVEANEYARTLLVPREFETLLESAKSASDVRSIARQLGVAPSVIAGRLQRDRSDFRFASTVFESFKIEDLEP